MKLEEDSRKEKIEALKEAENTLQELNDLLNLMIKSQHDLNEKIPESAAIGVFLKQLNGMIRKRQVALISVDPQTGTIKNQVTQIPLRMIFKGPFLKIYRLIHDLENLDRAFVITEVVIAKPINGGECLAHVMANIFERRNV